MKTKKKKNASGVVEFNHDGSVKSARSSDGNVDEVIDFAKTFRAHVLSDSSDKKKKS